MLGKNKTVQKQVIKELTASAVGSGSVNVFATPMMIALAEEAAAACIQPELKEGQTSVGTHIAMRHIAATPVGMQVRATATVTAVNGKEISFEIQAFDEAGPIGSGTHKRVIVWQETFEERAKQKQNTGK